MKHQLPIRPFLRLLLIAFLFKITIPTHAQAPNGGFSDLTQGNSGFGTPGYSGVTSFGTPTGGLSYGIPFSGAPSTVNIGNSSIPTITVIGQSPASYCAWSRNLKDHFEYLTEKDMYSQDLFNKRWWELSIKENEEAKEECIKDARSASQGCVTSA